MAEASQPITHKRVLHIAGPIVLSNATVPLLGIVDTGVVGQSPEAAPIAAVAVGAFFLSALYWLFGFLRMGTSGLVAQAHGAKDHAEVSALLTRALLIGTTAGLAIFLLQIPLFAAAFWISPASAEVETLARDYMQIRVFSAPALIALYGITGWLVALERTRAVLVLQLWMNGLNMGLSILLGLQLDWGITGVALATLIAEWTGLALGLYLCRSAFRTPDWRNWARVFDRVKLRHMALINSDIMMRSLMIQCIFGSFLLLGGKLGDITLAANQVLLHFLEITAYAMDGFAFAAEALVGQSLGARNRSYLRRATVITLQWSLAINILFALSFALFGTYIIDLMAKSPDVRSEAYQYLPYMVLSPILGVAAWVFDGVFIGATRSADMRNMMALSLVIYVLSLIALVPFSGNHGLWIALLISLIARGATLAWRYPALEAQAAD